MRKGRRKAAIYATIIVAGLAAGLVLRASIDRPQAIQPLNLTYGDRVVAMAQLFEAYCIGALRGKPLDPNLSLMPANLQGNPIWVERSTDLYVELDLDPPRTCSVSDAFRLLSPSEKTRLTALVAENIPTWAPELSAAEPAQNDFFLLKAWTTQNDDPTARWGILLMQFADVGPDSSSMISIGIPSD
jgi:hypothetical protein